MAMEKLISVLFSKFILLLLFLDVTNACGLQLGFYSGTCPNAEQIAYAVLYKYISRDPTLAPSLLRMHFHDCFVRGYKAEKEAFPNLSLRGFHVIDAVKSELEKKCPGVVSCADILALVARDAVFMIGGPSWDVPTGRRDGRVSIDTDALEQLPSFTANITELIKDFSAKGLSVKDLVVLSGGHTIGIGHCSSISDRLYNFTGKGDTDPSLDPKYASALKEKCKLGGDNLKTVEMDPGSFRTFDEGYYSNVAKRRGLLRSDAALLDDVQTRTYVQLQSVTHGWTFAQDFGASMIKMGSVGVLTGNQGEIRKRCAFVN
ncbi:hypothetical protein P3X46_018229 [Hevea brasiliensis]|uniref:Peroxidase n=1 Tax=Hevea brasiliensis TaxID=3981 RepID=A0ABQ9LQ24_HEVBR|nr:peroxidase 27 isoform X2 [Hevea brasiliensis]KAJ9170096.1 hypothetical protein P3X46_018229 [Hevea brasiliensis]